MAEEKIIVRDFRKGDRFQTDNILVDEYLKKIGANAFSVYSILCRHANNKTQRAYPGRETISSKLGKSKETVDRAIEILKSYKMINVIRTGKGLNNTYDLFDKLEWKK